MAKIKFEYKISFLYLIIGGLWILFSDELLYSLVSDEELFKKFQTYKGWFYVLVTAMIFFFFIKKHLDKYRITKERLEEQYKSLIDLNLRLGNEIEKKETVQQELKESERKFKNLFNSIVDPVLILDYDNNILEVNNIAIQQYGYSRKEFLALQLQELIVPGYFKMIQSRITDLKNNESGFFESMHIVKSRKKIPVEVIIRKIKYDNKPAVMALCRNVSEKKEFEKKLFKTSVQIEELERERYAKELHDGLGPLLSTCKIYFHTINNTNDKKQRAEYLQRAGELLEESLQSIKEISNNLSPHVLRNYGLTQALNTFVRKLKDVTKIKVNVISENESRIAEVIEFTLYRTFIELLNNSMKYSKGTLVNIILKYYKDYIEVEFIDDGIGFDYKKTIEKGKGFGLLNLKERIKKIDGSYQFDSSPGNGVYVKIRVNY